MASVKTSLWAATHVCAGLTERAHSYVPFLSYFYAVPGYEFREDLRAC